MRLFTHVYLILNSDGLDQLIALMSWLAFTVSLSFFLIQSVLNASSIPAPLLSLAFAIIFNSVQLST